MSRPIPATFYEQFLEDESNSSHITYEFISKREVLFNNIQTSLIRFGGLALVHPFNSARLLRQVQFGTISASNIEAGLYSKPSENEFGQQKIEMKPTLKTTSIAEMEILVNSPIPVEKDEQGYVQCETSEKYMPVSKWPLQLNKRYSIWTSTRFIASNQGLNSLWNGLLASWIYDLSSESLYLGLDHLLTSKLAISDNMNIVTSLVRGCVNFAMTPFDMLRTRFIALSIFPSERKVSNLFSAFAHIFKHEGGVSGLYPQKLFSLFYSFIPPLLRHIPLFLFTSTVETFAESIGIPAGVAFASIQLITSCAEALILSPLETIRRRLFLQSKSTGYWIYRVPISPQPYTGFWNAIVRIYREEGVSALYQGLPISIAASLINFVSTALVTIEAEYTEDLEAF